MNIRNKSRGASKNLLDYLINQIKPPQIRDILFPTVTLDYPSNSYGEVEWVKRNMLKIKDRDFAPGIWAGTEGMIFSYLSPDKSIKGKAKVIKINLSKKIITFQLLDKNIKIRKEFDIRHQKYIDNKV